MGIHTATASRIIKKVSNAIASLGQQYIQMPQEDEMLEVQREFFNIASFPRVVGCIDGTHIKIQSPGRYRYFFNRMAKRDRLLNENLLTWCAMTHFYDQYIFF